MPWPGLFDHCRLASSQFMPSSFAGPTLALTAACRREPPSCSQIASTEMPAVVTDPNAPSAMR